MTKTLKEVAREIKVASEDVVDAASEVQDAYEQLEDCEFAEVDEMIDELFEAFVRAKDEAQTGIARVEEYRILRGQEA